MPLTITHSHHSIPLPTRLSGSYSACQLLSLSECDSYQYILGESNHASLKWVASARVAIVTAASLHTMRVHGLQVAHTLHDKALSLHGCGTPAQRSIHFVHVVR